MTPVMKLLWPTGLKNFLLQFTIINFENNMIESKILKNSAHYPAINQFYTDYGFESYIYILNAIDLLLFAAAFIAMIPLFFFLKRFFSKV
jgi:hypothetical protein